MGMGIGNQNQSRRRVVAEINVTPLVDVMLVLLIIFMVAAGVQNVEMEHEREQLIDQAQQLVDEAQAALAKKKAPEHTKVGVDLPKVDSQKVNLHEVKKLKLTVDGKLVFRIDETVILDCIAVSPPMKRYLGPTPDPKKGAREQAAFEVCLKALGEKLVDNHKLQEDKELYVLADRNLDYGKVLRIMAAVRQAGVTKFGLVAQPGLLGDATVAPTPDPLE